MSSPPVATLLLCFLLVALTRSAPLSSAPPAALRAAVERAKTLVEKILRDVPAVYEAAVTMQGLTLDPPSQTSDLQMMVSSLGIPPRPRPQAALRDLHPGRLYLRADLRDLHTHINKMKEAAHLVGGGRAERGPGLPSPCLRAVASYQLPGNR
ncbi:hypothetical protein CesoFtcFv8_019362 [Champsocephalus esox]|uniref:Leptin n=1 Tax=Champsocephalus esox TaxID=159716 RepID=A0AAN8BIC9_9TELE|nr:hypothetical protein CesoFtcFv8_019362 [Champsocephalus esox]